jgi:hypothetical protein
MCRDATGNSGVAHAVAVVPRFALATWTKTGTSVVVTIDWGDDTTLATDAERLRQGERSQHAIRS